jgi:hypothetical protein
MLSELRENSLGCPGKTLLVLHPSDGLPAYLSTRGMDDELAATSKFRSKEAKTRTIFTARVIGLAWSITQNGSGSGNSP